MGCQSWSSTARRCDSCKEAPAAASCRADAPFFCAPCDAAIHGGGGSSRHPRVPLCEFCEQAPAAVTCRADSAVLCHACDGDVHSANPLARRHERVPISPSHGAATAAKTSDSSAADGCGEEVSEAEAEAASWLLPDPNRKMGEEPESPEYKPVGGLFGEMDPNLDLDLVPGKQKTGGAVAVEEKQYCSDGVVPVQGNNEYGSGLYTGLVVDGLPAYDVGYYPGSGRTFMYNFTSQSMSQSLSSSSLDVGVVPEHKTVGEISDRFTSNATPTRLSAVDREARVLRYKEKRKRRKFEKTIRYASRKAYAETRPRVKGRFAKRMEENDGMLYGVVPTF